MLKTIITGNVKKKSFYKTLISNIFEISEFLKDCKCSKDNCKGLVKHET